MQMQYFVICKRYTKVDVQKYLRNISIKFIATMTYVKKNN